jgi:hypothetical protein
VWVVAVRAEGTAPAVRATVRALADAGAAVVDLQPLDEQAVAELSADLLGAVPDAGVLASASRARGAPLLLVELLRGLHDEGLVRVEAGTASLVADELPARLRDAVTRRTERTSAPARELLQVGAVLGRRCSVELLAAVVDRPLPRCSARCRSCSTPGCCTTTGSCWRSGTTSSARPWWPACRRGSPALCAGTPSTCCWLAAPLSCRSRRCCRVGDGR